MKTLSRHLRPTAPPIHPAAPDRPSESTQDASRQLYWTTSALLECLTLVGGLLWIMNPSTSLGLLPKSLIVAGFSVLGGAAFVLVAGLVARRKR